MSPNLSNARRVAQHASEPHALAAKDFDRRLPLLITGTESTHDTSHDLVGTHGNALSAASSDWDKGTTFSGPSPSSGLDNISDDLSFGFGGDRARDMTFVGVPFAASLVREAEAAPKPVRNVRSDKDSLRSSRDYHFPDFSGEWKAAKRDRLYSPSHSLPLTPILQSSSPHLSDGKATEEEDSRTASAAHQLATVEELSLSEVLREEQGQTRGLPMSQSTASISSPVGDSTHALSPIQVPQEPLKDHTIPDPTLLALPAPAISVYEAPVPADDVSEASIPTLRSRSSIITGSVGVGGGGASVETGSLHQLRDYHRASRDKRREDQPGSRFVELYDRGRTRTRNPEGTRTPRRRHHKSPQSRCSSISSRLTSFYLSQWPRSPEREHPKPQNKRIATLRGVVHPRRTSSLSPGQSPTQKTIQTGSWKKFLSQSRSRLHLRSHSAPVLFSSARPASLRLSHSSSRAASPPKVAFEPRNAWTRRITVSPKRMPAEPLAPWAFHDADNAPQFGPRSSKSKNRHANSHRRKPRRPIKEKLVEQKKSWRFRCRGLLRRDRRPWMQRRAGRQAVRMEKRWRRDAKSRRRYERAAKRRRIVCKWKWRRQ